MKDGRFRRFWVVLTLTTMTKYLPAVPRARQTALFLLVTLTLTGCSANWQPLAIPQPKPLPERTVVEFHVKDSVVQLHGVRFTQDSVSGISWLEHLSCDSCRVSYALKDISQTRTGEPGRTAWPLMTPVFAFLGLVILLATVCGLGGCHFD